MHQPVRCYVGPLGRKILFTYMISIKNRIKLFETIRDIPFFVSGPEHDCSCLAKTKILGELLTRQKIICRVAECLFKWETLPMDRNTLKIVEKLTHSKKSNHQFLRVFIPERRKWVSVDPTWDRGLKKSLPITHWDGVNGTVLAVKTNKFIELKNNQKSFLTPFQLNFSFISNSLPAQIKKTDVEKINNIINNWITNIRSK